MAGMSQQHSVVLAEQAAAAAKLQKKCTALERVCMLHLLFIPIGPVSLRGSMTLNPCHAVSQAQQAHWVGLWVQLDPSPSVLMTEH